MARRLSKSLFTLASAASLLLCVGVCILWVRSYGGGERLAVNALWAQSYGSGEPLLVVGGAGPGGWAVFSYRGRIRVDNSPAVQPYDDALLRGSADLRRAEAINRTPESERSEADQVELSRILDTPHRDAFPKLPAYRAYALNHVWLSLIFLGGAVLFALPAVRRRHPVAAGGCATCGYDLRATPDRCPECGAVPRREG